MQGDSKTCRLSWDFVTKDLVRPVTEGRARASGGRAGAGAEAGTESEGEGAGSGGRGDDVCVLETAMLLTPKIRWSARQHRLVPALRVP